MGESVTGIEIGIQNLHGGSCKDGQGDGSGTSLSAQASCMTILHMHKAFSHPNEGAENCDIILWTSLSYCKSGRI